MEEIKQISINDENYPDILKKIPDPPKILYYKGKIKKEEPCLGIVGTRRCSSYGRQATFDISGVAAESGLTIVSGMAPGIDTFAHNSAVKRNKRTIAVLGTGLDEKSIYPKENILLSRKIVEAGGCLISEYPIGTGGTRFTFPRRNRIIAGLSLGVLVIESKQSGGSMITASYALVYKRKLFSLPGSIYALNSKGTNYLIKNGAKLVDNIYDILKELNLTELENNSKNMLKLNQFSEDEKSIISILKEPLHIDKIIEMSKLDAPKVLTSITLLEAKGKIKDIGENVYYLDS